MRYLCMLMVVVMACVWAAPDADAARKKVRITKKRAPISAVAGVADPRYAALIMNPVTGEIYHQANADARRYPASLTKMMTLYLLFEALENRKTSLDARLDISEYATTMPQTHLSLTEGDSIPVETAIKALVVRSANDVSVVVAEALAGDVDRFADRMTAKARQLGMRGTVFQNPNGLPNSGQYTTARDMAKLGIALKRDFPQYYSYFNVRQFSWEGRTYYTHNRVMLRYPGTDGIKTGYIGASGFNLVSSVTRGGRPLVGVVLGGASGSWRDNRMITLLDSSYKTIAARGAVRGKTYTANLPLPVRGAAAKSGVGIEVGQALTVAPTTTNEESVPEPADAEDGALAEEVNAQSVFAPVVAPPAAPAATFTPAPTVTTKVTVIPNPAITPARPNVKVVRVNSAPPATTPTPAPETWTVPVQPPVATPPSSTGLAQQPLRPQEGWGIQVGAFSTRELAEQAARQALQIAATQLQGSKISVIGPTPNGATVHRARVENITQLQARKACEALISNNSPCFIFKTEEPRL